jgi:hypothetical protein
MPIAEAVAGDCFSDDDGDGDRRGHPPEISTSARTARS